MTITAAMVKDLREKTGVGVMECKEALRESNGDMEAAISYLRKKGLATAAKKGGRATREGLVGSYIHAGGKIGVLVEVGCETDFVARTPQFQELVKDLAMHIAAASPLYLSRDEVPPEVLEKEREIYGEQARNSGKPEKVIDKIVEGKLEKYCSETCLLEQPFVKDPDLTVKDLISQKIAQIGENIQVKQFARFQVGRD
ncbi:MAG: translation elongation factor Ts [Candidatus Tectomicrobia bacterium]|uniref:Elongation factor Ts n=1 Tax=Tectimicrobiota bacterium TaxID=2528274 RepID=A0A932GS01_UNCTE|nr:translation elongation factor Ts [Candidatus Tectomicrobia bacterium]